MNSESATERPNYAAIYEANKIHGGTRYLDQPRAGIHEAHLAALEAVVLAAQAAVPSETAPTRDTVLEEAAREAEGTLGAGDYHPSWMKAQKAIAAAIRALKNAAPQDVATRELKTQPTSGGEAIAEPAESASSRSQLRRIAAQKGEPAPDFSAQPCVGERKYMRLPSYDLRIKNGDDFAGDAWVCYVAPGHDPNESPFERPSEK